MGTRLAGFDSALLAFSPLAPGTALSDKGGAFIAGTPMAGRGVAHPAQAGKADGIPRVLTGGAVTEKSPVPRSPECTLHLEG